MSLYSTRLNRAQWDERLQLLLVEFYYSCCDLVSLREEIVDFLSFEDGLR